MTATPRQLDHGMLNIPLSKRGDIDAQIDRYKASQSRQAKARNKATLAAQRAAIAEAKAAIAAVSDARMAEIGKPLGLTAKATRAQFLSAAWSRPAVVTAAMKREAAQ